MDAFITHISNFVSLTKPDVFRQVNISPKNEKTNFIHILQNQINKSKCQKCKPQNLFLCRQKNDRIFEQVFDKKNTD